MRTITTTVYNFSELSEDAKETALQEWTEQEAAQEYSWSQEAIESLKAGIEHFGCALASYSIDFANSAYSDIAVDTPWNEPTEDEIKDMIESAGSYNPETLKGLGDCKLTGYCMDENFLDGVRSDFYNGERDLKELMLSGYNNWHEAATNDYESQFTMEYFSEHAEANEYEFTEDGKRI
jgi:hypothetical protein